MHPLQWSYKQSAEACCSDQAEQNEKNEHGLEHL